MDVENKEETVRGFLELPAEIIEHILIQKAVDFQDVVSIMKVCTNLKTIGMSNELWRHKLSQKWPWLVDRFDKNKTYNWYEEFKRCYTFQHKVHSLVEEMSPKYYKCVGVSKEQFSDFLALFDKHDFAADLIIYELMSILKDRTESLTMKYYAEKALRYLQQNLLTESFRDFLELPPEQQSLEIGATLLAQWCQPKEIVTVNNIKHRLDSLAEEVKNEVCKSFPTHPLASNAMIDTESFEYEGAEGKKVLDTLNKVLFTIHRFTGNSHDYYTQSNSYIDKVLKTKTGIPISLSILYLSVAKRLGVICEPVNFPRHFLLRWKQDLHLPRYQMYTYIDVFNGGKFLRADQLEQEFGVPVDLNLQTALPLEVILRMLRNLIMIARQLGPREKNLLCLHDALSLHHLLTPRDLSIMLLFAEVSVCLNAYVEDVHHCLNSTDWIDPHNVNIPEASYWSMMSSDAHSSNIEAERKELVPKTRSRPEDALYSVGLIMKHKRYNYICVIYGWDEKCKASPEWIEQMGVNNLPNKDEQPFYNVLVTDGSNRYAAEESLEYCKAPQTISHPQVGKYFKTFNGIYYVPNQEKACEYPEDVEMTQNIAAQHYS